MRCEIIAVGTELLMGQIVNRNAMLLARDLAGLGIGVYYQTVVGDNEERLAGAFTLALERADLIIFSGGLGPTTDDITRETVARVLNLPLVLNDDWAGQLRELFARAGRPLVESNLRQAMLPCGGRLLPNDRGTAPGICIESAQKIIFLLPGPPGELLPMFRQHAVPILEEKLAAAGKRAVLRSKVLRVTGPGESLIAERIKDVLDRQGNPTIAPLAKGGEVHLRITAMAGSVEAAEIMLADKAAEIYAILGDAIYGEGDEGLEYSVARLLLQKNLTIALGESCSGGLLSHRLTNVPGSSAFMLAGVVAYSNEAKTVLLGVEPELISSRGAVSAAVAARMAAGARRAGRSHIGMGITGIAGPGGGTEEKPVGLTYIALEAEDYSYCRNYHFLGSRLEVKERVSQTALHLLRQYLLGKLKQESGQAGQARPHP